MGLVLCELAAGVLAVDCQFYSPWNAEAAWGLEDNAVGSWGTVAGAEEGEVSKGMLIGYEGVTGEVDDNGERSLIY